jgi:hypothetical protein
MIYEDNVEYLNQAMQHIHHLKYLTFCGQNIWDYRFLKRTLFTLKFFYEGI